MKVIARIPALQPVIADGDALVVARADTAAASPASPAATTRRSRRRRTGSRFPVASVTVLAILAGFVWSLASWNESRRLERARADRVARLQGVQSTPGTTAR